MALGGAGGGGVNTGAYRTVGGVAISFDRAASAEPAATEIVERKACEGGCGESFCRARPATARAGEKLCEKCRLSQEGHEEQLVLAAARREQRSRAARGRLQKAWETRREHERERHRPAQQPLHKLSDKERAARNELILRMYRDGHTQATIAARLCVSWQPVHMVIRQEREREAA